MNNVNYHYHKFAGYVLFPLRLVSLCLLTLSTVVFINLTDILGNTKLSYKLLTNYGIYSTYILGMTIHCENIKLLCNKPSITVSNHINMYDHYVMTYILNKAPSFITIERYNIFPIKTMINTCRGILYNPNKKGNVVEKMKQRIKEGGQVFIYPDGCNPIPDKKLIAPFKSGAFVPKAPIQPIVIRYVPSSNTNMNWHYEDSCKDNTPFSLLKSYLLDGDIQVYVKVLPLQHYKDSYKSHEDYRDEIYELMTKELSLLPEQKPNLLVGEPSNEYIMKYLIYLLYLSGFSYLIGNKLYCSSFLMNFIAGYFCHFYPTKNTCLVDSLCVSYGITKSIFTSIQNDYDFYFRCLFMIFTLTRVYNWLQYKNDKPFDVKKHVWNTWIPMYTFSLYPLLLNTLELYNII
jgi:1-acyl-sn-glycerol-3-phosphate acyltransferase